MNLSLLFLIVSFDLACTQKTHQKEHVGKKEFVVNATIGNVTYTGELLNGKMHGFGTIIEKSGDIYIGNFILGKKGGLGSSFSKRDNYTGYFLADYRHGYGTLHFANGDLYKGGWLYDRFHGNGTMIYKSRVSHVGFFKNGRRNGFGVYSGANVDNYTGMWKNGKKEGFGNMSYIHGSRYIGYWFNDSRNGNGTFIKANGELFVEGIWRADYLVRGVWKQIDETNMIISTYMGEGMGGFRDNYALFRNPNGSCYEVEIREGTWEKLEDYDCIVLGYFRNLSEDKMMEKLGLSWRNSNSYLDRLREFHRKIMNEFYDKHKSFTTHKSLKKTTEPDAAYAQIVQNSPSLSSSVYIISFCLALLFHS